MMAERKRGRTLRWLLPVAAVVAAAALALPNLNRAEAHRPADAQTTAWVLPAHPKLYVLGDSWASGYRADPKHTLVNVAAADLKWQIRIDAIEGTGYGTDKGTPGNDYVSRSRVKIPGYQPNVILLQGTGNDYYTKANVLRTNALTVVRNLHHSYPKAHIVMLGPGDDQQPYPGLYTSIDKTLTAVAKSDKLPYISMYRGKWITPANFTQVIDVNTGHPSLAGHRYLGHKLSAALRKIIRG
jgi:hypothetical protein